MTDADLKEFAAFVAKLCPEAAAELEKAMHEQKVLLDAVAYLEKQVDCLPSSDEQQQIFKGILLLIKAVIVRKERST